MADRDEEEGCRGSPLRGEVTLEKHCRLKEESLDKERIRAEKKQQRRHNAEEGEQQP